MAQDHTQLIASTAIVVVANEKHTVVVCPQSHAVLEEAAETICCLVNAVSMCQSTFNFDDFLLLSDIIILVGKETSYQIQIICAQNVKHVHVHVHAHQI